MTATVAADLMESRSLLIAGAFALCGAGEALLTAWPIELWFGPHFRLDNVRSVLGLLVAARTRSVDRTHRRSRGDPAIWRPTMPLLSTWRVRFAADTLGIITVAPLFIGLASVSPERLPRREAIKAAVVLVELLGLLGLEFSAPAEHWATFVP